MVVREVVAVAGIAILGKVTEATRSSAVQADEFG